MVNTYDGLKRGDVKLEATVIIQVDRGSKKGLQDVGFGCKKT